MKKAIQVAEYILRKAREADDTVTPMQIKISVYVPRVDAGALW